MSDSHRGLPHDLPEYVPNVRQEREESGRAFTVLMVGGPGDGIWKVVQSRTFEVLELPRIEWKANVAETDIALPVRHQYHVDMVSILGFTLRVAVCERQFMGTTERNKTILRALLQRDVAQQMGVL